MSATVLSFFRPAPTTVGDWSQQELAEFYRVEAASVQAGLRLSLERGLSDEGDPWLVFCREDGDVFLHFARIDGAYVICSDMIDRPLVGPDFRALLAELVRLNPSVLPLPRSGAHGARSGAQIMMHPAALLAAIVATTCLFASMNEAVASELDGGSAEAPLSGLTQSSELATGSAPVLLDAPQDPTTRSRTTFDREFALITGVILACVTTFSSSHVARESATVSHLPSDADGISAKGQVASASATVTFEASEDARPASASHSLSGQSAFVTQLEAGTIPLVQSSLQDTRVVSLVQASHTNLSPLALAHEIVAKTIQPADLASLIPANFRLLIGGVGGLGTGSRTVEAASTRERATPSVAGAGTGGDEARAGTLEKTIEVTHAQQATAPASADTGSVRATTVAASADLSAPRVVASTTSVEANSTRAASPGTGTDTSSSRVAAASDSLKTAIAPAVEAPAVTTAKVVVSTASTIVFGATDSAQKGITSVFGDVTALSAKMVSLILHALVDARPSVASMAASSADGSVADTGSAKIASGTELMTSSTSPAIAGTEVGQAVSAKLAGQFGVLVSDLTSTKTGSTSALLASNDRDYAASSPATTVVSQVAGVTKVLDGITKVTAALTTDGGPSSSETPSAFDSTKAGDALAKSAGVPKTASDGSITDAGQVVTKAQSAAAVDPTDTKLTGVPTSASDHVATDTGSGTGATKLASQAATDLTSSNGKTTVQAQTVDGAKATVDTTAAPVKTADATAADSKVSADHKTVSPGVDSSTAASADALATVAALTSTANIVSKAVSVSLTAAAFLDATQMRIIDLFLNATPDAKFRTVENTLEIYDPSASPDASAHASMWDIGGGAFVRVIGISDAHLVT